jgi:hypothetical protein
LRIILFLNRQRKKFEPISKNSTFLPKNSDKGKIALVFIKKGGKNMQSETQNAPIALLFGFRPITNGRVCTNIFSVVEENSSYFPEI